MRPARAGMDLHRQHLRPPPRQYLDFRQEPRGNPVVDEDCDALLQTERVAHAPDVAAPVLDAKQQRSARGVCKGNDRLHHTEGSGEVTLELQRLALRPLEDLDEVHSR